MLYTSQTSRKLPIKWISIEALDTLEFTVQSDVYVFIFVDPRDAFS